MMCLSKYMLENPCKIDYIAKINFGKKILN